MSPVRLGQPWRRGGMIWYVGPALLPSVQLVVWPADLLQERECRAGLHQELNISLHCVLVIFFTHIDKLLLQQLQSRKYPGLNTRRKPHARKKLGLMLCRKE